MSGKKITHVTVAGKTHAVADAPAIPYGPPPRPITDMVLGLPVGMELSVVRGKETIVVMVSKRTGGKLVSVDRTGSLESCVSARHDIVSDTMLHLVQQIEEA